ncbi:DUF6233 domain-containing protein [Streptomyces sp. NBC_01476]|uniref:DUF6233 domain-containing protein n=1 Tax=Streptomyces sp. NBC_01476 TaxID=2903881 RepID=UPI002E2F6F1D|nr:DUF6233 domain-containing protein [Streptomyces sp. NBC_01476]
MSDPLPRPVTVTLPGVVAGRLLGWQRTDNGWVAEVAVTIPAANVRPADEKPAPRPEPAARWVVAPLHRHGDAPDEVHRANRCWYVTTRPPGQTVTQDQARAALAAGAIPCQICDPQP